MTKVTDLACIAIGESLTMNPELLTRTVRDFLSEAAGAVVLEDGAVAFDLTRSKYSISGEQNKCLLHMWSAERNTVRRVLEAANDVRLLLEPASQLVTLPG